jgi:hypothetical protein
VLAKVVEAPDKLVVSGLAAAVVNFHSSVEAVVLLAVTHSDTRLTICTLPETVNRVSSLTITFAPVFTTWSLLVNPAALSLMMTVIGYAFM